ncbi:RING/U-box superfamily protein, putative isoform 1 [Hibiscus syriacus]|uniref:RING/U-box superfamily protein, putative isoform 1 n=1 Tax=Hibiscus syriacus TaxID=106335 RepID=A0A6A3CQM5_HIBSY|nr:RING/U-box superfamily protein, putative isoform 1 [Hibiscus syriacus]
MAYRRRHALIKSATFKEEIDHSPVAAAAADTFKAKTLTPSHSFSATSKGFNAFEDSRNESKGFWGVLARKAKAILEEDDDFSEPYETETPRGVGSSPLSDASTTSHGQGHGRIESPRIRRGSDKLNTSLNHIGDTFEDGRTIVGSKTHDIIQETRNLKIRRKGSSPRAENQVAMATAAKAKLLLRELKSVKEDLAFAKERCAQLEEENKILRECREKGDIPEDDDLIRFQLESLLAEKARLAHENSIYARENRFLREVVEYHQLSMQDLMYLYEGVEEVTEVGYPFNFPYSSMLCESPTSLSEVAELSPPSLASKEGTMNITSPPLEADNVANWELILSHHQHLIMEEKHHHRNLLPCLVFFLYICVK